MNCKTLAAFSAGAGSQPKTAEQAESDRTDCTTTPTCRSGGMPSIPLTLDGRIACENAERA